MFLKINLFPRLVIIVEYLREMVEKVSSSLSEFVQFAKSVRNKPNYLLLFPSSEFCC